MKTIKRAFGIVVLTAVMAVGALHIFNQPSVAGPTCLNSDQLDSHYHQYGQYSACTTAQGQANWFCASAHYNDTCCNTATRWYRINCTVLEPRDN